MNYQEKTFEYYSNWFDIKTNLLKAGKINYVITSKRDEIQSGYNKNFDIYIFKSNNHFIVSYSQKAEDVINKLKCKISTKGSIKEIKSIIKNKFKGN